MATLSTTWATVYAQNTKAPAITCQSDPDNTVNVWIRPAGETEYAVLLPASAVKFMPPEAAVGIEARTATGTGTLHITKGLFVNLDYSG